MFQQLFTVKLDSRARNNAKLQKPPMQSVVVFLLAAVATAIFVDLILTSCTWNWQNRNITRNSFTTRSYSIYVKGKSEKHLFHVVNILDGLGFHRVNLEDDWNLLWAHDYPFIKMAKRMKSLENFQIVNHFPGCGYITSKVELSTTPLPFIPVSFRLPTQRDTFLGYAQRHPNSLFVGKHNEHRHVTLQTVEKIDVYSNEYFVQEFIQNPFLVDGHKFDIGVYVVVTSIDPLRLYIYSGDVLLRFCPDKYHPFNASRLSKFVVGDNYLPTWKVPSLIKYYNRLGGSMRGAFDAYVRDQNLSPLIIWQQVEHIIRQTLLYKQQDIVRTLRSYKTKQFFDLMRFDLIVDDSLKVYLIEANMSPNLSSTHFKPNALLYEQILYSVMNLVGIGSPLKNNFHKRSQIKVELISERNLATNVKECSQHGCDNYCDYRECDLCIPCLSDSEYDILEKTHYEHLHKISMKRIFPKPILQPEDFDIVTEVQNMTKRNAWLSRWFYYKCLYDSTWCN